MNPILLSNLLAQIGTVGIPYIIKLMGDISAGRNVTTVTPEDLLELARLSALTSDGIYAKLGITPPPHAPAATPV